MIDESLLSQPQSKLVVVVQSRALYLRTPNVRVCPIKSMWFYWGHYQLRGRFGPLDQLGYCHIWLAIVNHKQFSFSLIIELNLRCISYESAGGVFSFLL